MKRKTITILDRSRKYLQQYSSKFWRKSVWNRLLVASAAFLILLTGAAYGTAQWYIARHRHEPIRYGATFIPSYARYFELDPQDTMRAMIDELGLRRLRLVTYWSIGEPRPDEYDFSEFDWQMRLAEEKNVEVTLAIGLRQPRWPECHMPEWATNTPMEEWYPHLKEYMQLVIERYKDSPALRSYQLENEFFLSAFGTCKDFSRERLIDEYNFVKTLDPEHTVIINRSNNAIGFPVNEPRPDLFGVAVYKRVWEENVTKRYFEYPLPPWFYAFLAGGGELLTGKNLIIHELQTEPWIPRGMDLKTSSIAEQDKSMDTTRLRARLQYARNTGLKTIDFWGAEWWYWRKVHHNDPSLWEVAREEIAQTENTD